MIDYIISLSIKNKAVVLMVVTLMAIWGIYSAFNIPFGTVPDITNNQVQVITTSRNLSTEDIEQFISYPIELEMANLPGVKEVRSLSKFGLSVVTVVFEDDLGTYLPRQLIAEKLKNAEEFIPKGFGTPAMGPISTGLGEIYQYILDVKPGYDTIYSAMDLRTIQDWVVKRHLAGIPGVVEINTWGGYLKQYEVSLQPEKLKAMNISLAEVFTALQNNNENTGGSYIERYHESYFIRGEGLVRSVEDIENIVVRSRENIPVLISHIAEVNMGYANRFGAITANGEGEKVMGQIMMLRGADVNQVIRNVKQRVGEISDLLPEGVYINPFLERSELISKTSRTIQENLFLGASIVFLVVILLLGNWRAGLIIGSIIPLAFLFAIAIMNQMGLSANLMSMGAIDFGIIIDGGVIIVEYILYQYSKNQTALQSEKGEGLKKLRDQIATAASGRMMHIAFFGQVIILIVFIPIFSLSGIEGKMFRPMATTFSLLIIGAMILCLTYIPAISALLLRPESVSRSNPSQRLMKKLEAWYVPTLQLLLKKPWLVVLITALMLSLTWFADNRLGGEFVPTLDEGDFVIQPILKPGTSLSENIHFCTELEKLLIREFPEVSQIVSRIGAAEVPTDPMSMEMSDIIVRLHPIATWKSGLTKEELADKMKEVLEVFPSIDIEFTQPIEMRFNELITGTRADLAIKFYGEDMYTLYDLATRARGLIEEIEGVSDISVEQVVGLPQMTVQYDRQAMARHGLQISDLNRALRIAYAGESAGLIYEGEKRFDLVVRYDQPSRFDIQNIYRLHVDLPGGATIPLSEVADIQLKYGPAQISRENTRRRVVININARSRDLESLVGEIRENLNQKLDLPEGYYLRYGGQFENMEMALERLKLAVPLALLLIFVMLFFAFGSLPQALMVYSAIPLAVIGGVFSLWLRGMPFSISAGIGFIALFGIATLNGIVMISYFNELKDKGIKDITMRVLEGARNRLRPVLLTATTTGFGFLPMAVSTSAGAEVQKPLATVVIGGLFTSTVLTLLFLPVIYHFFGSGKWRFSHWSQKSLKLFATIMLLALPISVQSQSGLSLEEALQKARKNNIELENARLRLEETKSLKKTAWDLGSTDVQFMRGNIDGPFVDNNTSIWQNLGSVFEQHARAQWMTQWVNRQETAYFLSLRNLERDVSLAWYALLWRQQRLKLLDYALSIYQDAVRIAVLRYESGQANLLSKVVVETQYEDLRMRSREALAERDVAKEALAVWLMISDFDPPDPEIFHEELLFRQTQQGTAELNLQMELMQKELKVAQQDIKWQRSKFAPGLSAGYWWQSLDEIKGYDGWQVGIQIPLWRRSLSAQVQASKIRRDIAENQVQQMSWNIQRSLGQLLSLQNVFSQKLEYFENTAIPNASLIEENADVLFKSGEIEYFEYIRGINEAVQLRLGYADAIQDYNETSIQIFYLLQ
jgi:heavy metal efflux system protein